MKQNLPNSLEKIKTLFGGGGGRRGDIISQLVKGFIPFSQLVKLFWRVSQILINLV